MRWRGSLADRNLDTYDIVRRMIPSPSFQHTIEPSREGYAPCATSMGTAQHHARTSAGLPTSRAFCSGRRALYDPVYRRYQ